MPWDGTSGGRELGSRCGVAAHHEIEVPPCLRPEERARACAVWHSPPDCEIGRGIGPDIALWNMSFFAKPALNGKKTPMHQEGEYWPIVPLATCTVWIAIDEATVENGCLRYIPGSHKERRLMVHEVKDDPSYMLRRRAPRARDGRLLSAAGADHRHDQPDADQPRGGVRAGRVRDPGQGLRRCARGRERQPLRSVLGHLHDLAQSMRATSSATPRRVS
jgi:hypothetical protein